MRSDRAWVSFRLSEEHTAMLDSVCRDTRKSRQATVKMLLTTLLEDDAAAHGSFGHPDDKVIYLKNWSARGSS
jgi:hypothetical protein